MGLELSESFKTAREQGVDATWDSNYYVWAPAGTPDNVAKVINEAIMRAVEQQSFIDGSKQMGCFIEAADLESSVKMMNDEWTFMEALVTDMGLKTR